MVERLRTDQKLIREIEEIYNWLDSKIKENLQSDCQACGKCCDFVTFDHRLFVTIPEIIYLTAGLNTDTLKQMESGICPYNIEGKCSVYEFRFSGCRIFNCKADTDIQSELSEQTLRKLKSLCEEFEIPYRYMDLATALNNKISI